MRAYTEPVPKLSVVPPSAPSPGERIRLRRKTDPRPAALLQCRCGSREMIETKTGVLMSNGKPSGGTKQMLCAVCLTKGQRVVVA